MYDHIYFLGTGHVAAKCIEILSTAAVKSHIQCLGVEQEGISSIRAVCNRWQIPYRFFQPSELGDFLRRTSEKTLLISAHNQYIFPRKVVENPFLTIINFHNAYLPFYRGRNAPTWEIFYQESFGGATWHEVDATIDTGGIIVQEKVPVTEDETALSLLMKCANTGIQLFQSHLAIFLSGEYKLYYPETIGKLFLSKDLPNDGYLDSTWDFEKAYAFLRSMDYKMLDIMPTPRMQYNEDIYEIVDYTVRPTDPSCYAKGNQYVVTSEKKGLCLDCRLERIA